MRFVETRYDAIFYVKNEWY